MTAVAKVANQTTALAVADAAGGEQILSNDVVIPRLLLMQGLSDFVNERKAQQGDILRTTPFQVLGNPTKPVDFVPITFNNQWMLSEKVGAKFEFRGYEPLVPANQDAPWEYKQGGVDWKRTKVLNVFALLPQDIVAERAEMEKVKKGEEADPDKALLPVLVSFRSTSYAAGKDIVTHFAKAKKFGMPGYVSVLQLGCEQEKNEKGTYFVYKVKNVGKTSKEDQEVARYWHGILSTQKVQIEADGGDEAPASQSGKVEANSRF